MYRAHETKGFQDQRGMSLATVVGLMVIAGFLGVALATFTRQQQRFRLRSQVDGNLQAALDAGYDKALGALNTGSNWAGATSLSGMTSITAVAQNDLPDLQYWVKIMSGVRVDTANAGSVSDSALALWTNQGDLTYDRSIFVRARHNVTGREAVAVATVHRNDVPPYLYGGDAVAASGDIDLGNNWQGKVYDSCNGNTANAVLPNSDGSLTIGGSISSGWPNSNWTGYNAATGAAPAFPALVLPSTVVVPGFAKTSTINASFTLTNPTNNTTLNFEASALDFSGSKTITVNGPGQVALWLTKASGGTTLGMGGTVSVVINKNGSTQCCQAKMFTIYVLTQDPLADPGLRSISWNGTPAGAFLLVGPRANMEYKGGGSNIFKGAIVVQNLAVAPNSNTSFYYDACLKDRPPVNNYNSPPVITLGWKRVR